MIRAAVAFGRLRILRTVQGQRAVHFEKVVRR